MQRLRVLYVWHAAGEPQHRIFFDELIRFPGLDLLVVSTPVTEDRQVLYRTRHAFARTHPRTGSSYRVVPGRTLLPRSPGYHVHLDLAWHLMRFRPDVIHVNAEAASLVAAETAWLRRRFAPQARLLLTAYQNFILDFRWPWPWLERSVLRAVDQAVAGTPGAALVLRRRGVRGPLPLLRGLGVDPGLFRPRPRRLPPRAGLDPRLPVIGWAARMFLGKGLHVLLCASARMRRPHQLLVIGSGPREAEWRALADRLGIAARVHWAGAIAPEAMPAWYAAMDVYTQLSISRPPDMPGWKEQASRALVESSLAAVPMVVSDSGDNAWSVGPGGIMVPERHPVATARALDRLLGSAALRRRLGRRGRAYALANFTWRRQAEQQIRLWRSAART